MSDPRTRNTLDCIRAGIFTESENHPCFVIGCDKFCHPINSDTCSICNFKKCDDGHCACNLSEEARFAIDQLSKTFCEYCIEYRWNFVRMPVVGRSGLTVLEAKLDSAQTLMNMPNPKYDRIKKRLHDCLKIVRNAIKMDSLATHDYLKIRRCVVRETKKTRCNRSPAKPVLFEGNIVWMCKKHADCLGIKFNETS